MADSSDVRKASPHPVSEQSYYQAVLGFIKQTVPKSVISNLPRSAASHPEELDKRERILWSHFDRSGLPGDDMVQSQAKPYLVIGYVTGLQVWRVNDTHNVQEVLSLRRAAMSCARILQAPLDPAQDLFSSSRPLLAFSNLEKESDSSTVYVISMMTNKLIDTRITVQGAPIVRIESNGHVVALCVDSRIDLLSSATLQPVRSFRCHTQPQLFVFPLALGTRWLAFAGNTPLAKSDEEHSFTNPLAANPSAGLSAVVGIAQKTGTSLLHLGNKGMRKVTDMFNGVQAQSDKDDDPMLPSVDDENSGTVIIADTADLDRPLLAHFRAHHDVPVAALAFDSSGTVLVSACANGQDINVFHIGRQAYQVAQKDPNTGIRKLSWRLLAQHMYVLQRGLTTATICDVSFSGDTRWVAVTSEHGTTHVFPISPRGGPVSVHTHTSPTVRNASSFETSSGLAEVKTPKKAEIIYGALVKLRHPNQLPKDDAEDISRQRTPSQLVCKLLSQTSAMSTCFKTIPSANEGDLTSLGGSQRRALLLTFLVCTPNGDLIEHKMQPYGADPASKAAAAKFAMAVGGAAVGDTATLTGAALSTVGTVYHGVREVVRDAVSKNKHHFHHPEVIDERDLGVACAATRAWYVCRHESWQPAHAATAATDQCMMSLRLHDHQQPVGQDAASPWLAKVEISTYRPPHRPLWMGPQFTFGTFHLGPADVPHTANGIYSEQNCLRYSEVACTSQPLPVSQFPDSMHVVMVDIAGSPWMHGGSPPMSTDPALSEDLRAAMDDNLSGDEGAQTPTESTDTMFDMEPDTPRRKLMDMDEGHFADVPPKLHKNSPDSNANGSNGSGKLIFSAVAGQWTAVSKKQVAEGHIAAASTKAAALHDKNGDRRGSRQPADVSGPFFAAAVGKSAQAPLPSTSAACRSLADDTTATAATAPAGLDLLPTAAPCVAMNIDNIAAGDGTDNTPTLQPDVLLPPVNSSAAIDATAAAAVASSSETSASQSDADSTSAAHSIQPSEPLSKKSKRRKANTKIAAVKVVASINDNPKAALKDQCEGAASRADLAATHSDGASLPRGVSLSGLSDALSES
jgi:hypothetical protein